MLSGVYRHFNSIKKNLIKSVLWCWNCVCNLVLRIGMQSFVRTIWWEGVRTSNANISICQCDFYLELILRFLFSILMISMSLFIYCVWVFANRICCAFFENKTVIFYLWKLDNFFLKIISMSKTKKKTKKSSNRHSHPH